ncbi:molybdopterin-dependent oxidoreductase [Nocardioides sp. KC13]|uniref:Molybdopterin-dependent oxidoreductase n=1 Tax=Nocardioides turkmenicus TaxID=2711220 RepID=A0A6M1R277_9ACTN|nr:molybdopterin-dependent oxidoreductase [Nocardioides sp. KC13]NGN91839.1 molybdopterin-dependent oxidoreductase [Nocardioides sp. KC13]
MTTTDGGWQKTACILCENNCGLEVQLDGRSLVKIRGDKAHPNSKGYTCEKPLRLDKYQSNPHRLTSPLRRTPEGGYEEIDWDTAITEIGARLAQVRDEYGGDKIFYYAGGGQGNHLGAAYGRSLLHALGGLYYSNALAQEKVGEAWVDAQLYGTHTSGDYENSEVALFVGKNPWQSHGVAHARTVLREIARDPERALIVIDPRRSETAEIADIHLQVKPGTDAWCLAAILGVLVEEDLVDRAWLREHTTGADAVLAVLQQVDVTDCSRKCGIDEELIRTTARRIARASSLATYEDIGVQQGPNSTLVSYLNKLQWILTGNFAKPGAVHMHSWLFPLVGSWHHIPPERPIPLARTRQVVGDLAMRRAAPLIRNLLQAGESSPRRRAMAEKSADVALSAFFDAVSVPLARRFANTLNMHNGPDTTPVTGAPIFSGLVQATTITEEILTDHPDRLRAMWVDASNPVHSLPDSQRMRAAFEELELTVVVDVAMTETARCADYVLPATSQFEKWEGSLFTLHFPHNAYQARAPLMDRLAGTRPEPEIYVALIDELGVVDQVLIDQLTAAARIGRKAFALAFFSTLAARPELTGVVPYLLYKTLGSTLPDGQESLAVVWGMAHLCAIGYPDGVSRAGHQGSGFDLGESLFAAIQESRQGVTITDDRYEDAWGYIHHDDKRIHVHIPALIEELGLLLWTEPRFTSSEFPLTLSAGERRAFTANVIFRDPEWRRRDKSGALRISSEDAAALGVQTGDAVRVVTEVGEAAATVEISDIMQAGHISLPNGFGLAHPDTDGQDNVVGTPPNELTGITRRDKFFLTPWHKNVPARIERLESEPVAVEAG